MSAFLATLCLASWVQPAVSAVTLFNGAQQVIFKDAPTACLSAFDRALQCDPKVQLLSYDMDRLEFTDTDLSNLCTTSCKADLLDLDSAIAGACGDYDIDFNGAYISAAQVVDLFVYKYNMSCLAESSGSFCLKVEETWNVGSLDASGTATWPTYTNKTYPDFSSGDDAGAPAQDIDGTLLDLSDPPLQWPSWASSVELEDSGQDYYSAPLADDWQGHGWPEALEYDEYPLEIQCSECFLAQYKQGIESQWGEVYDEVSDQVWNNIKRNCELDWELTPANNQSSWTTSFTALEWKSSPTCEQTIQYQSDDRITANALALANNVPTAALIHLNPIGWLGIGSGSYCAPLSCQVAIVHNSDPVSAENFIATYKNITKIQFWSWNAHMDPTTLRSGEVVCVGPSGGSYAPVSATPAMPTVFTTTATPPAATPSGTIPNCGKYAQVNAGDECNTIALANSITLADFISMNPEIDNKCTNLWVGYAYCVAFVDGTTATPTSVAPPATTVASAVPPPTQTVDGSTSQCNKWYTVKSGDSCYSIQASQGITLARFRSLNTYIDADCTNLWLNYAYCVDGIPAPAATTSTAVPAPTSTVTGTTSECYQWYTVKSGDDCGTIDDQFGITLQRFRDLNTYVDEGCTNIWPDTAYCVDGVAKKS